MGKFSHGNLISSFVGWNKYLSWFEQIRFLTLWQIATILQQKQFFIQIFPLRWTGVRQKSSHRGKVGSLTKCERKSLEFVEMKLELELVQTKFDGCMFLSLGESLNQVSKVGILSVWLHTKRFSSRIENVFEQTHNWFLRFSSLVNVLWKVKEWTKC